MSASEACSSSMVNLLDLAASALASSVSASLIIRDLCRGANSTGSLESDITDCECEEEEGVAGSSIDDGQKNTRLKKDGTYVTDADFAAQGIIIQSLREISQDISIVGEESAEEMAQHIGKHEPLIDLDKIYNLARYELYTRFSATTEEGNNEQQRFPLSTTTSAIETRNYYEKLKQQSFEQLIPMPEKSREKEYIVDSSRVHVFVDPLDGTKSYAHGQYDSVTVLVGIVLDQVPVFGVICKPFAYQGLPSILHTECVAFYGGLLLNDVCIAGSSIGCKNGIHNESSSNEKNTSSYRAVISASKSQGVIEEFCTHLGSIGMINPQPLLVSGAGEKSLRLILRKNNEVLWFYPKAGTYLWDVAASDALLRPSGCRITDKFGKDIDYSKPREQALNSDGIVAASDPKLHKECIRIFNETNWETS